MDMSDDYRGQPGLSSPRLSSNPELVALLLLGVGLLGLFLPTYITLAQKVWATDEQGHGPIILGVSLWLLWRMRGELWPLPYLPANLAGFVLLAFALSLYVIGRSQDVLQFEVGSQILVLAAILLLVRGPAALKRAWFPLFFLLFMVPLPGVFVQAVTLPLKSAVSYVAEVILYQLDYPIGRTGVILTVGQYQLLVADACAGLNSIFTLEALGLLYMNLMGYTSKWRNVLLAILILPISFVANIVRVVILILITYHFGDEAGQGFVHAFAGIVLFLVGLILMTAVDALLGRVVESEKRG
jgi:exosortase B